MNNESDFYKFDSCKSVKQIFIELMKSIFYKSNENCLNEIEYFVDNICEEFNLSNSLYGNILITITEAIKILEESTYQGEILFCVNNDSLNFTFKNFKQIEGVESIFEIRNGILDLNSSADKSLFMVRALSDDLIINREAHQITCVFKNKGREVKISKHRKDFLKNYLNQEVEAKV